MKKFLALLLCVATLCGLTGCGSTNTKEGTEGLTYEQSNGSYIVTGYHGDEVNVVIPDTYNDIPVVGISQTAFYESEIQSVVIGKNVTSIEVSAFSYSSLLKSITITGDNIYIDNTAFGNCTSLDNVKFTQSKYTLRLESSAFYGCTALTKLDFSGADTTTSKIDAGAFSYCNNLATITVPSDTIIYRSPNIITIDDETFFDCDAEIVIKN